MMDCDLEKRAREIIEAIGDKLDSGLIRSRFDEPIAKVTWEFECEVASPVTHKDFNKILADFVRQIYEKALRASWMLTDPLAEAIFLLEKYYNSPAYGPGYAAAVLHANDVAEGGVQAVLAGLAESVKNIERKKYIDGIFTWHLHSCSWELQCEIVRLLLEDYRPYMSPLLCKCVPAQLVDEIPLIMYTYICGDFTLQQISLRSEKNLTAERLPGREMP